jgi:branched-chain amino acid transport system permease protein
MVYISATNFSLLLILLAVPFVGGDFLAWQVGLFLIYGIASQGVGIAWGQGGFLPLGNALFFGIGGYGTAITLQKASGVIWIEVFLIILVAMTAAAVAWLIAVLLFRKKSNSGPYFSLITLALVLIAEQLAETNPQYTGGFNGYTGFPALGNLDPFSNLYFLIVGVVVTNTTLLMLLNKLPAGLTLRAIVSNEARMQHLGFATYRIKAAAFALSAFITAVAGSLFACHQGIVTPQAIGFILSAEFIIWAAVGGKKHPLGPLIGAVGIGLLSNELKDSFIWWEVLIALLFLFVVVILPGGLLDLVHRIFPSLFRTSYLQDGKPIDAPDSIASGNSGPVRIRDLEVQAGDVKILQSLTFEAPANKISCIIGPNGAGKTTLLNAMTGVMTVNQGSVEVSTRPIEHLKIHEALSAGIGRKLQVPAIFNDLTVEENLQVASIAGRTSRLDFFRKSTLVWKTEAHSMLVDNNKTGLLRSLNYRAGELSQGHKQFLEMALALGPSPSIVLLDEPTAGMSRDDTRLMIEIIKDYQKKFNALIIVIEHDMRLIEALECQVFVLNQGSLLAEGSLKEIRENPAVTSVYAGGWK